MKTKTEIELETIECGACGVVFALSTAFIEARRQDHKTWWCPNGCERCYPAKSKEEILQDKLAAAAKDREWLEAERRRLIDAKAVVVRSRDAYKGQVTRLKNRASAGVCPCCNRHFTALERHMATKHPGYAIDAEARE